MKSISEKGVSPVIGVILMVAVTVALVALVTVVVFDIGDDVSEPADITINTDVDTTAGEIEVEVVRNENVDELTVQGDIDGSNFSDGDLGIVGDDQGVGTATIEEDGGDFDEDNSIDIVATVGDNDEIVATVDYGYEAN